ncbi:DUF3669 domain-containing protein [Microdochium nivale]|nr:DUF3669 domain-containing protein [Microdochium nivale]
MAGTSGEASRLLREGRRQRDQTEDSTISQTSSLNQAMLENLALGDKLQKDDANVTTASQFLQRMLSLKSVISTGSSYAERQQAAIGISASFREIGTGSIGKIFEHPGTVFVYKLPLADQPDKLWNNYLKHKRIENSFASLPFKEGQVEIPQCYCGRVEMETSIPNKDCLIRPCLGRIKHGKGTGFFSLRNFKLHANQAQDLGLDLGDYVQSMAHALAVMHWHTGIDAKDIEFVLGSSPMEDQKIRNQGYTMQQLAKLPAQSSTYERVTHSHVNFNKRVISLWMIDFDDCHDITMNEAGVDQAVKAFLDTNFYCPKPGTGVAFIDNLWTDFAKTYVHCAEEILKSGSSRRPDLLSLPQVFIRKINKAMKDRNTAHE